MVETRTEQAMQNLQKGIKKMEKTMTPAAVVRRAFLLGRPPKAPSDDYRIHPGIAWDKAVDSLNKFRARMKEAGLKPEHAEAVIVYVEQASPSNPKRLLLEQMGKSAEELETEAYRVLGRKDVVALGMVFKQFDDALKKEVYFPHLYVKLNDFGHAVLIKAAENEIANVSLMNTSKS